MADIRIGDRVLVVVSGLAELGVPEGHRVSTSGTVIDTLPAEGEVTVHLDVGFQGHNIINVSRERVRLLLQPSGNSQPA